MISTVRYKKATYGTENQIAMHSSPESKAPQH